MATPRVTIARLPVSSRSMMAPFARPRPECNGCAPERGSHARWARFKGPSSAAARVPGEPLQVSGRGQHGELGVATDELVAEEDDGHRPPAVCAFNQRLARDVVTGDIDAFEGDRVAA